MARFQKRLDWPLMRLNKLLNKSMPSALLVIDVQTALCTGHYATFESKRVINRINLVSEKARAAKALVIFIQHASNEGALALGSEGWQLADGLVVQNTDTVMGKTATDSFHKTPLQSLLEQHHINHLIVCGMQSDFCVDTTARRALGLGYPITLVSDGHTTLDNEVLTAAQISAHHTLTLANITSFGPRVTPLTAEQIQFNGPMIISP
jgi:nicotinamidase-related amidase